VPRAYLGGRGFWVAVARTGRWETEAFAELPTADLPHVHLTEPAPGVVTLTAGVLARPRVSPTRSEAVAP
jgi:hypothetical protein